MGTSFCRAGTYTSQKMSVLITILGVVFLGTLGPAMFGAWYAVPAYTLPVFLILWKGTSKNALIWGSISAVIGEMACGLMLGTIALPFIVFFALLYGARRFISWKPFCENEKWTPANIFTALIIVPVWHVFVFVLWVIAKAFTGGLASGISAYAMLWFNVYTILWIVGTQILFLVLCYMVERRKPILW